MKLTWFFGIFGVIVAMAFVWWTILIQMDGVGGFFTGFVLVASFVWTLWSAFVYLVWYH